jgi:hypothetical protein
MSPRSFKRDEKFCSAKPENDFGEEAPPSNVTE